MDNSAQTLAIISTTFEQDPRRALIAARSNGFTGIEFDAISPTLDLTELSQTGRREFRHMLVASDLTLVALRADTGPKGFARDADIDRLLARLTQVFEAAKALVVRPLVCIDIGALPEPPTPTAPKPTITPEQAGLIIIPTSPPPPPPQESRPVPAPDPAAIAHVDAILHELCTRADRVGVTLAVRSDLSSYAALDRAITAAACPWFGIDLDPVAILRDHWGTDEVFSRLGGLVRHVRARDATVGHDHRTRPAAIGHGDVDWGQLAALLDEAGYNGWLTVDPLELSDRQAAGREGLGQLREVVG